MIFITRVLIDNDFKVKKEIIKIQQQTFLSKYMNFLKEFRQKLSFTEVSDLPLITQLGNDAAAILIHVCLTPFSCS